jgi:hypothetical protein
MSMYKYSEIGGHRSDLSTDQDRARIYGKQLGRWREQEVAERKNETSKIVKARGRYKHSFYPTCGQEIFRTTTDQVGP